MKKIYKILIGISAPFIIALTLPSCFSFYSGEDVGNIFIGFNYRKKNAFIGGVNYQIGSDPNIVLPDNYNGLPVTQLGGYYGRGVPCPFSVYVSLDDIPENCDCFFTSYKEENIEKDATIHEYLLTVTLPKNLKEVKCATPDVFGTEFQKEDGTYTYEYYVVKCDYVIDENNEHFYTENGKLYNKKDKTLVQDLIYR